MQLTSGERWKAPHTEMLVPSGRARSMPTRARERPNSVTTDLHSSYAGFTEGVRHRHRPLGWDICSAVSAR
jgi:hypothetical protein